MSRAPRPTLGEMLRGFVQDWIVFPLKIIVRNKKALVGFIIILGFALMAIVGPEVVPQPLEPTCPPYEPPTIFKWPPSLAHPLGCDYMGYDIWAQIVWGSRTVLEIAFIAGFITIAVGITVGMVAGFLGGRTDTVLMGITDVVMTIPGLPLLIVLASLVRTSNPAVVGLILSVTAWAGLARAIRSQVLSLKYREFVEAAKALGMSTGYIVFREIMPNLMSYIAINFIFSVIGAIYGCVGLYFLGMLPFTSYNWGIMLNMAYSQAGALYTPRAYHYLLAPIIAVVLLQAGLILFSYAIDEIFNPRLRTELR